ncbi:Protein of uncharacterised function (Hypoth_ymh) [Rothia aeria]|uniref:Protein of uncharacterized function (Hypoth_ymh) n=1 Tax=Rothia aeria TaxID=172042 RepID=A0A7Z9A5P5_9MICC|nr:TIGR02391 family protein [Rothia aeria]VEI23674.1 Protein of uncharacterised function (Hypoth_ymh) [Rothia aeria]
MDYNWALAELQSFIDLTELVSPPYTPGDMYLGEERVTKGKTDEIIKSAQIIEQILDRVIPAWRNYLEKRNNRRWQAHRQVALRAVSEIEHREEIAEKLGDKAPKISAAALHPWVWESARSLWQSGHYRTAVQTAVTKLNAETQNKVGRRDVSEKALFSESYSSNAPEPGKARLRPANDDGGKTASSIRRGIASLAEGLYAAIRNPASHDLLDELEEHVALEQLAAVSMLARFVDDSTVVEWELH